MRRFNHQTRGSKMDEYLQHPFTDEDNRYAHMRRAFNRRRRCCIRRMIILKEKLILTQRDAENLRILRERLVEHKTELCVCLFVFIYLAVFIYHKMTVFLHWYNADDKLDFT